MYELRPKPVFNSSSHPGPQWVLKFDWGAEPEATATVDWFSEYIKYFVFQLMKRQHSLSTFLFFDPITFLNFSEGLEAQISLKQISGVHHLLGKRGHR